MTAAFAEFTGTALLVTLGNGVVANVLLSKTKGHNSGWLVITFGWAMALFVAVYTCTMLGGSGHLNPAVTLAFSYLGEFDNSLVVPYIIAQFTGAIVGSILVWIVYKPHYDDSTDPESIRATFCTSPNIYKPLNNALTEGIGTFILMFGVLAISPAAATLGTLDALPVSLLLLGIGLSLGGPTGYAINPARDLGPRFAHFILPLRQKGNSGWNYAWVPVIAPVIGAVLAALVFNYVK
ncbi:MAG: aquaporin family protein [Bacteroidetes bacterium]|nr:aquaporin family protein [Bacteroidota bacterium]MBS1925149.1 aquaporin family protein [Bacteroidota bacterium]MCC6693770.1 aquaporin family protein [Chitinophagaceae bacterium]HMU25390.1 MIP/aquaporin family protein [Ferruginibacter sp.]